MLMWMRAHWHGCCRCCGEPVPLPTRVFLACGVTDMRKGFDGLAVLVQQVLTQNPHSGALFAFRGKRGHLVKQLRFDGQGLCLFSKRPDHGRFVWPVTATGTMTLTPAELSMLLEGIDWRRPERTFTPTLMGENGGFASLSLAPRPAICYVCPAVCHFARSRWR